MEFHCLRGHADWLVPAQHSGFTIAGGFGDLPARVRSDTAPTLVESVTEFLEQYNRAHARTSPRSEA